MLKAQRKIHKTSGSTEIPFAPMIFSASADPIPIEPPDTTSLTAMPELRMPTVIPTADDWRENPRWKPLIGTPSKAAIATGTLVPDPSPVRTCSDTASDAFIPPSPAGSFVHRRRRGEYAQRPPVWTIQGLVEEDIKGWYEEDDIDLNYFRPEKYGEYSDDISYANQLDRMADVITQEPLIVAMAIEPSPSEAAALGNNAPALGNDAPPENVEIPISTNIVSEKAVPSMGLEPLVAPLQQGGPLNNVEHPSQDTTAATTVDEAVVPWLATIPSAPDNKEEQCTLKREMLTAYNDIRSQGRRQIVHGSLVVCIGATTSTHKEDEDDQFKFVFGGLYRVLQIFGDTWAFCQKLPMHRMISARDLEPPPADLKKLFGAWRDVTFMVVGQDSSLSFLPLCAVTLWENFEEYCQRARIGSEYTRDTAPPDRMTPSEGGIVKAAPRFSSTTLVGSHFRNPEGVLVPELIYKKYLKPVISQNPQKVYRRRRSVDASFEQYKVMDGFCSVIDARRQPASTPSEANGTSASRSCENRRSRPVETALDVSEHESAFASEYDKGAFLKTIIREARKEDPAAVDQVVAKNRTPPQPATARPSTRTENDSPTRQHVECTDGASSQPPTEEDAMSAPFAKETGAGTGTWKRITNATQRMGTKGRKKIKDYFAPPDWVTKSPHQVRTLF
ncbi:hypothetical protein MMC16_005431 [Acarospora aff. strigata]|nr:hypothetical protein [Acarospora aff. strigata]